MSCIWLCEIFVFGGCVWFFVVEWLYLFYNWSIDWIGFDVVGEVYFNRGGKRLSIFGVYFCVKCLCGIVEGLIVLGVDW